MNAGKCDRLLQEARLENHGRVSSQEITLLKLSEHINLWELRLILHYDLCINQNWRKVGKM